MAPQTAAEARANCGDQLDMLEAPEICMSVVANCVWGRAFLLHGKRKSSGLQLSYVAILAAPLVTLSSMWLMHLSTHTVLLRMCCGPVQRYNAPQILGNFIRGERVFSYIREIASLSVNTVRSCVVAECCEAAEYLDSWVPIIFGTQFQKK